MNYNYATSNYARALDSSSAYGASSISDVAIAAIAGIIGLVILVVSIITIIQIVGMWKVYTNCQFRCFYCFNNYYCIPKS